VAFGAGTLNRGASLSVLSLGAGLAKAAGKVFRICHLGNFNDLMLMGTLCGVEMTLNLAGGPHKKGGT
jgi:alanine-glyoxylate transaminase / serine-glyoxylate transaminase / serine-pyruvate transaminase